MTRQRNYNARCEACGVEALCPQCGNPVSSATPFSDWLREQSEIDSSLGYVTTNVDFLWSNYKTGRWIFLEEKRYGGHPSRSQTDQFRVLDNAVKDAPGYGGLWILTFEATTPEDGRIWLYRLGDVGGEIDKDTLIDFLVTCGDARAARAARARGETVPIEDVVRRERRSGG